MSSAPQVRPAWIRGEEVDAELTLICVQVVMRPEQSVEEGQQVSLSVVKTPEALPVPDQMIHLRPVQMVQSLP